MAKATVTHRHDRLQLDVRCGGCFYLNVKHPKLEAPCEKLGKISSSLQCKLYDPDWSANRIDPNVIMDVGRLTRNLTVEMRHHLAFALINADLLEKVTQQAFGFTLQLGQPCWVNLSVPSVDYLNCWYKAAILGVTQKRDAVILYAETDDQTVFIVKSISNALWFKSNPQFKEHIATLIKSKRINAPMKGLNDQLPQLARNITVESFLSPSIAIVSDKIRNDAQNNASPRKGKLLPSVKSKITRSKGKTGDLIVEIS